MRRCEIHLSMVRTGRILYLNVQNASHSGRRPALGPMLPPLESAVPVGEAGSQYESADEEGDVDLDTDSVAEETPVSQKP